MRSNPMDDALAAMEAMPKPAVRMVSAGNDWFAWRKKHPAIRIGKTGEDGQLSDWQDLLRTEGAQKLDTAISHIRSSNKGPIYYQAILATLEEMAVPPQQAAQNNASKRARIDELVWCLCHRPECYADAIGGPWLDVGEGVRADPLTPERRTRLEAMAADARKELLRQTGCSEGDEWKPRLYETVRKSPRLLAWLRSQRLIPSDKDTP